MALDHWWQSRHFHARCGTKSWHGGGGGAPTKTGKLCLRNLPLPGWMAMHQEGPRGGGHRVGCARVTMRMHALVSVTRGVSLSLDRRGQTPRTRREGSSSLCLALHGPPSQRLRRGWPGGRHQCAGPDDEVNKTRGEWWARRRLEASGGQRMRARKTQRRTREHGCRLHSSMTKHLHSGGRSLEGRRPLQT